MDEKEKVPAEESKGLDISRRSFMKGMSAAGIGAAFLSTTFTKKARAQWDAYELPAEKLLDAYDKMLKIRWFDRTYADRLLTDPDFRSYGHIWYGYSGQEAISVGVCAVLNGDDWIQCTHRSHGGWIAKGGDLKKLAAEMTFKAWGIGKGYGGGMHLADHSIGYLSSNGVVGPGALMAAGAAFGIRSRGGSQVAVNFAGEGAYPTGGFHVAMNEAALFKLPFINVIENNLYLATPHYTQQANLKDIADAATGYHIPGVVVDGQDFFEVYASAKRAVERARAGEGPSLIEAKTYRYYAHSGAAGVKPQKLGSFGMGYRPDREVRAWMARDPIDILKRALFSWDVLTESKAEEMEEQVKQQVAEAFKFADDSPVPKPEDGLKNVYVEGSVLPRQLADCPLYEGYKSV